MLGPVSGAVASESLELAADEVTESEGETAESTAAAGAESPGAVVVSAGVGNGPM
jgi:hypothetical protein